MTFYILGLNIPLLFTSKCSSLDIRYHGFSTFLKAIYIEQQKRTSLSWSLSISLSLGSKQNYDVGKRILWPGSSACDAS